MKLFCDLHIHSALSPCGDMDMTPNNIVNMAILKGLSMIALTDHNSVGNVRAMLQCAKDKPLCVVPGMELETMEEAHFVCLFPTIEQAEDFEAYIQPYRMGIENRPDIFGEQAYMNAEDDIIAHEPVLLAAALTLSIYDAAPVVSQLGGVILPAHVDKSSYSVISNLGAVPEDLGFTAVELSKNTSFAAALTTWPYLADYQAITSSDAHYLWDIYETQQAIDLAELSAPCLVETLRKAKNSGTSIEK
ncbi:MAG: PHP domain-containing protein [Ruminococcaceae bacterium]|nr:PHP domain-containing protein [Oscillospiraceae bacterium]